MGISNILVNTRRYPLSRANGEKFHNDFVADEYVNFPSFLSLEGLTLLRQEINRISTIAKRRDFVMEEMACSPRHMVTIGGKGISERSSLIPLLYADNDLRRFIGGVFGEPATLVDDATERHVVNILEGAGDTHGAHFDDFPLALVVFLDAPGPGEGGEVEVVPRATSLADLDGGSAVTLRHAAGDAYLLKADTAAHRVLPLRATARRIAINMAFARAGATTTTTTTASLLYD